MGVLRLLLALSVVAAHAGPFYGFTLVGGTIAVQSFYIISGFYMALILTEKYTGNGSKRLFYSNRFLRLYPIYLAVLVITLVWSIAQYVASGGFTAGALQPYIDYFSPLHHNVINLTSWIVLVFTNVAILGQDVILFLGIHASTGTLFFTKNYQDTVPQLHLFLLIPQAWTISVELLFYAVAPFIVRRKTVVLVGIMLASLVLRVYLYYFLGLNQDPWTYRFFPTELFFFLLGAVVYRIYRKLRAAKVGVDPKYRTYLHAAPVVSIVMVILYPWIPIAYKTFLYFAVFALLLPLIFMATNRSRLDNFAGELSYPVYICHVFIITLLLTLPYHEHMGILTAVTSIVFAYLLNVLIANPIENVRQKRVRAHYTNNPTEVVP